MAQFTESQMLGTICAGGATVADASIETLRTYTAVKVGSLLDPV